MPQPFYLFRRTLPLMLADACGVLMAVGWEVLGIVCAAGAAYAVDSLITHVREEP